MTPDVDVLIPAAGGPDALAVTLATVSGQTHRPARVVVAGGWRPGELAGHGSLQAVLRVLDVHGVDVEVVPAGGSPLPAVLGRARARYALVVPDGVVLAPEVLGGLLAELRARGGVTASADWPHARATLIDRQAGPGSHRPVVPAAPDGTVPST